MPHARTLGLGCSQRAHRLCTGRAIGNRVKHSQSTTLLQMLAEHIHCRPATLQLRTEDLTYTSLYYYRQRNSCTAVGKAHGRRFAFGLQQHSETPSCTAQVTLDSGQLKRTTLLSNLE